MKLKRRIAKRLSRRSTPPLCQCGCGGKVKRSKGYPYPWNKIINGHNRKGIKDPELSKRLRKDNPMFCPEACKKLSMVTRGVPKHTEESKEKLRLARIGRTHTEESKRKIGMHPFRWTDEYRLKQSISSSGRTHTEESKRKIGKKNLGSNNGQWRGGSSFGPYSPEFTRRLKRKIRRRDNYCCFLCNIKQPKTGRAFPVHHIDYIKSNNKENNLITLCVPCHNKTTGGKRREWIKIIRIKIIKSLQEERRKRNPLVVSSRLTGT